MVSISVGVACMLPSDEHAPSHLVNLADQQLYNAKAQGRNRVSG
jgi:diguanylate cyclase (GGDEF)-like protein